MNIKFLKGMVRRFNSNIACFYDRRYICAWLSEFYCFLRFGCSPDDFFRYEFYKKSNFERDKFITFGRNQRIIKRYNDAQASEFFRDKARFNAKFDKFLHREWLDLRKATVAEFYAFLKKHTEVIMKPLKGGQGKGIFKLSVENAEEIDLEAYRDYVVEEILVQHPHMDQLNPNCINTIRGITFQGKFIACALRMGGDSSIVDNLNSNGLCAHIDMKQGIIDAPCLDKKLNRYWSHPLTATKLIGFEIPNWESVKECVEEAAKVLPEVGYIGWDVAILKDGAALIEGNHDPGHSILQMITQSGLYKTILNIKKH